MVRVYVSLFARIFYVISLCEPEKHMLKNERNYGKLG